MKKNTLLLLVLAATAFVGFPGLNPTVWAQLQRKPALQKSQVKAVPAKPSKLPDLIVSDIKLIKDCKIQITIKNAGRGGVPDSGYHRTQGAGVQMYNSGKPWGGTRLFAVDPAKRLKKPGASVTHVWFPGAANLALGPGTHSIKVTVDNNNAVAELNEKNNSKTARLVCKKQGVPEAKITKSEAKTLEPHRIKPDLTVVGMKIEPENPTTEDTIKFSAYVKNVGAVTAPPSKPGIKIGGEAKPMVWNKPAIKPQSLNGFVRLKQLTVPQNYRVTFIADAMNDVDESNENNNEKYLDFKVAQSPPLRVVYPTNSQHFQVLNNKIAITVRFNKSVNKNSVITQSSFQVNAETDNNASGTIQWINDSELVWTSTKNAHDLCIFNPDCSFTLTITDSVTDTAGHKLDGDKDGNPDGNFTHIFTIIG